MTGVKYVQMWTQGNFWSCQLCGAMVEDTDLHDQFHDGLDAAATLLQSLYEKWPKRPTEAKETKDNE